MSHSEQKKSKPFMIHRFLGVCIVLPAMLSIASPAWAQFCQGGAARSTPDHHFSDAGAGMVLHKPTGLIWKRCAEGQTWSGMTCTGEPALYLWSEAFERVAAVNAAEVDSPSFLTVWARMFGSIGGVKPPEPTPGAIQKLGKDDWRLPNINELLSIVETACEGPSVNTSQFPGFPVSAYWSSSPVADIQDAAWAMATTAGLDKPANRWKSKLQVHLVRGGNDFLSFDSGEGAPVLEAPSVPVPWSEQPQQNPALQSSPEARSESPSPAANSENDPADETNLPESIGDLTANWPAGDQFAWKPAHSGNPGVHRAGEIASVPSLEALGIGLLSLLLGGMGMRAARRK